MIICMNRFVERFPFCLHVRLAFRRDSDMVWLCPVVQARAHSGACVLCNTR